MLPLNHFELIEPQNLEELVEALKIFDEKTKLIAGGTDLLPNLKQGLYDVEKLVSLRKIVSLKTISIGEEIITIGAGVTLSTLAQDERLQKIAPVLGQTAVKIASPQIRNMGTVGGNICLDTRCLYINQSHFWRSALGYCLKKDGACCHVVKTGKRCVAAASNDLATTLLALDASVHILSPSGERRIKLAELYTANGEKNTILAPSEVVTAASFSPTKNLHAGFAKLRHREAIDFAMLSIGVAFLLDEQNHFNGGTLVVNALTAKPKVIALDTFADSLYTDDLVNSIAKFSAAKCHPQTNICDDPQWRKLMIEPYVTKAFSNALMNRTIANDF